MNFIVVADENYGIGINNMLLTYLPEDLKYFKEKTMNKVIVMGRKTLESLPGGKPLPKRKTIILTRKKNYICKNVEIVHSIEELNKDIKKYPTDEIFIAGGANIYEQLIPYCEYGYITKIHKSFKADTFMPNIDKCKNWELIWESEIKNYNDIKFTFTKYRNNNVKKL